MPGPDPYPSAMPQLHSATSTEMYPPANGLARRNGRPPRRDTATPGPVLANRPPRPSSRPEPKPAPNPFAYAHALLRGRYPIALAAGTVLATLGGVAGFMSQTPIYSSVGQVQVEPRVDRLVYTTDENQNLPQYQFNNIILGQAAMLGSSEVAEAAVKHVLWAEDGWGSDSASVSRFRDAMNISVPRGGALIEMAFESEDPEVAYVGAQSAMVAYEEYVKERRKRSNDAELKALNDKIADVDGELKAHYDAVQKIIERYGDTVLTDDIAELTSTIRDADIRIDQLKDAIAERDEQERVARENGWTPSDPSTQPGGVEPELPPVPDDDMRQLAESNAAFRRQYEYLQSLRTRLAITRQTYGEGALAYRNVQRDIAEAERTVFDSARFLLKTLATAGKSKSELAEELATFETFRKARAVDRTDISDDNAILTSAQRAIREKELVREDFANELNKLQTESPFSERVRVLTYGSLPTEPSEDKRLQIGAVGALFGGMLGFGLVALWGLSDGRLRWLDDPRNANVFGKDNILAALPDMQGGGLLAGEDDAVAFQLHKLRLSLQRAMRQDRRSFAITSPVSGDGKTSVTMALGLSLAASGTRTLLVDFDLVGKSLSRRFASKKGEDGVAAVDRGLGAILRGTPVADCFLDTDVKRLSVLGCADAGSEDARRLSPKFARHVLREAMEHFEIVLVDTGPLLASLEANTIAAETDGSVLCVSRGTDRKLVERSVEILQERTRSFEGIVINRLDAAQFDKFVASTMSVSVPNDAASTWRGASAKGDAAGSPRLVTRSLDEPAPARRRSEDEADS